ncbi:MAG: phosphate acyltransferase PlsX [Alphaproteobacteria bacterium]
MSAEFTVALDAMGGDRAPDVVVKGANIARERHPSARFLFVGDEGQVAPLIERFPKLSQISKIRHTTDVVTNDDKPSVALRNRRNSSMRLAINAVGDGEAAAVVSAGNTGALMAMSKFVLKTLPGIDRPAIASVFPTLRGESVMLDLGANIECSAANLVQFAAMGEVFARLTLGILEPTVGLLNVGEEELKGREPVRAAAVALKASRLNQNFLGFIEGDDIAMGTVDVIVTDGFSGNVALKTAEGVSKLFSTSLRQAFGSSFIAGLGYLLAKRSLSRLWMRMDPRQYNGAVFLGLNGITVKSHGGTDALGFASAISVAVDMVQQGYNDGIREEIAVLNAETASGAGEQAAAI